MQNVTATNAPALIPNIQMPIPAEVAAQATVAASPMQATLVPITQLCPTGQQPQPVLHNVQTFAGMNGQVMPQSQTPMLS